MDRGGFAEEEHMSCVLIGKRGWKGVWDEERSKKISRAPSVYTVPEKQPREQILHRFGTC